LRLFRGKDTERYAASLEAADAQYPRLLMSHGTVYMKGVVMRFRLSIIPAVTLLIMSMGLFCGAEAKTIEAGHATVGGEEKA
jgi:hypothetical protein